MNGIHPIPPGLVSALARLGLTNDEARVFGALVLLEYAEAKEIVEYLSLSKPTVYKSLENLVNKGLVITQRSKPARYRAISSDLAVSILMKEQDKAAEQALLDLTSLEQEKVRTEHEEPLWTIYGDAAIEHKIKEMFRKAGHHLSFVVGDRYAGILDEVAPRDIPLRIVVLSSAVGLQEKIRGRFPGRNAEIHVIPLELLRSPPQDLNVPEVDEAWRYMKFENVIELNVDDEELLISLAFLARGSSVLVTRNKGAIVQMKMFSQLFWSRFVGKEEE